jgi:hypothetical protein
MFTQATHLRVATAAREAGDAVMGSAAHSAAVAGGLVKSYVRLVVARTFATAAAYRFLLAAYRHEISRSRMSAVRAGREIVLRDVAALRGRMRPLKTAAVRTAATNVLWHARVARAARAATRASAMRAGHIGRDGADLLRAFMAANGRELVAGFILAIGVGLAVGLLLA